MTIPKMLTLGAVVLFGAIGFFAWMKSPGKTVADATTPAPMEVTLPEPQTVTPPPAEEKKAEDKKVESVKEPAPTPAPEVPPQAPATPPPPPPPAAQAQPAGDTSALPNANRIQEFFNRGTPQLSIVKTITYTSRVDWMQGRPAWLADYAAHYRTSRHFIARSLNGTADYDTQNIFNGDQFNVLRDDKNFSFYLLVDASRCKMFFYYLDKDTDERVLLKCYDVALGRPDAGRASGSLTPFGKYTLGDKIATYKPGAMGYHLGNKIEMITVFGTRWIPFAQAVGDNTGPAKGLGIHGAPWKKDEASGQLIATDDTVTGYQSDGCIRMSTKDVEELFAIIITRPTMIEIVKDYFSATLPGHEPAVSRG